MRGLKGNRHADGTKRHQPGFDSPAARRQKITNQPKDITIMEETTNVQEITARQQAEFALTPVGQQVKQFEVMQRMGQMYSTSTIVPEAYRGNIGNCIIALDIAMRMKLNPLMCMQNLYVVQGNPSWSSKFLIATINMSGKYSALRYRKRVLGKVGRVKYNDLEWSETARRKVQVVKEYDGTELDNVECVAYATELATGEVLEGDPVTIELAIREGWYTKPGSKWVTMPQLMLTYRAAAFWQRAYCPEISMGFMTAEEARDIQDVAYEEMPQSKAVGKSRLADMAARAAGVEGEAEAAADIPQPAAGEQQAQSETGRQPKKPLL